MRSHSVDALEVRAIEALRAVLQQVSTIKVRDLKRASKPPGRGIVAHIDVLGHNHTLACRVEASGEPGQVSTALTELDACAAHLAANATPVLIVPYLSAEVQALCERSRAGFLDLEGNARLVIGEVFIVKRSLPGRSRQQSSPTLTQRSFARVLSGFPAARAAGSSRGGWMPACGD